MDDPTAIPDDEPTGRVHLRLDNVSAMPGNGHKHVKKATISRFNWELVVAKAYPWQVEPEMVENGGGGGPEQQANNANADASFARVDNGAGEERESAAFLSIKFVSAESKYRIQGWKCTANIKITVTGPKKTQSWNKTDVPFPAWYFNAEHARIPWAALLAEYIGSAEASEDCLDITACLTITKQIGYGLMPLNDVLIVNGAPLRVNKPYLAAFSSFFRAMFFANHAGMLGGGNGDNGGEHQINDPTDNLDAFKLMMKIVLPDGGGPDFLVIDVLHLSDKYDLPNVTEICEHFLIHESRLPNIQKLGLADQYKLLNLKKHILDKIKPMEFCQLLDESIQVYNELSPTTRQALSRQMKRKSSTIAAANDSDGPGSSRRVRFNLEELGELPPFWPPPPAEPENVIRLVAPQPPRAHRIVVADFAPPAAHHPPPFAPQMPAVNNNNNNGNANANNAAANNANNALAAAAARAIANNNANNANNANANIPANNAANAAAAGPAGPAMVAQRQPRVYASARRRHVYLQRGAAAANNADFTVHPMYGNRLPCRQPPPPPQ